MSHASHSPANALFPQLLDGFDPQIKNINWDDPKYNILFDKNDPLWNHVKRLGVEEITDGTIGGTGIFDGLMVACEAHLAREYQAGRITGADYTKAYIATTQAAMANAVQYVASAEQQYWASVAARVAAINGLVELENTKLKYEALKIEAQKGKAEYALAKQKLATEDTNYAIAEYHLNNIHPAQYAGLVLDNSTKQYNLANILPAQYAGMLIANATAQYNLDYIMVENYKGLQWDNATKKYNLENILVETFKGLQWDNATKKYNLENILVATYDGLLLDNSIKQFNLDNMLPAQHAGILLDNQIKQYNLNNILPEQKILIMEQGNVQRAHTKVDRRDAGGTVSPIDNKSTAFMQNWLHWVQSSAFVRDSHIKAAKLFADNYAVMRTTDEGLDPPAGLSAGEANAALTRLKDYMDINVSTGWNL